MWRYVLINFSLWFSENLLKVAKDVSNALNNCVNCLPGQRDVDNAIRRITASSQNLSSPQAGVFIFI